MGLRSRAAHFVTDLTTVILNPISDEAFSSPTENKGLKSPEKEDTEEVSTTQEGLDTSSFPAFLASLLTSSESDNNNEYIKDLNENHFEYRDTAPEPQVMEKDSVGKRSLLSRGRQTIGRAVNKAARFSGLKQSSDPRKVGSTVNEFNHGEHEFRPQKVLDEFDLPKISEPSLLLSDNLRAAIYFSLPSLAQGRNWVLLYSTWRHGISLSTLYRRSMLCPGYSLLCEICLKDPENRALLVNSEGVVGDTKGAVFGGLVEAPLQPSTSKKYQGTNSCFVFTNRPSHPVIFHPTGVNRYYTHCSPDYLALGGGGHFALYLDNDLLNGSSSVSETFANSCLAHSEEFQVKEVELWGFVYASQFEDMINICRTEQPGICRW